MKRRGFLGMLAAIVAAPFAAKAISKDNFIKNTANEAIYQPQWLLPEYPKGFTWRIYKDCSYIETKYLAYRNCPFSNFSEPYNWWRGKFDSFQEYAAEQERLGNWVVVENYYMGHFFDDGNILVSNTH